MGVGVAEDRGGEANEAEKQRAAKERKATEAARAAEIDRLMALQKDCFEKRSRRLLVEHEQQVTSGHSQSTSVFSLPSFTLP